MAAEEPDRIHKESNETHLNIVSAYLPIEIVMNILVRLPVKSLLRFRCVCKSWCSLIHNPDFARKNLSHLNSLESHNEIAILSGYFTVTTTPDGTPATAIFTSTLKYNHQAIKNGNTTVVVSSVGKVDCPDCSTKFESCCNRILGCCDGILCVVVDRGESVLLWNPSINKYKKLPPPRLCCCSWDVGGIGYDPSIDDYKILLVHTKNGLNFDKSLSVEIFSLKSNSWKMNQDCLPYRNFFGQHSVFTNGGIHVGASTGEELKIVCFHVVTDKFEEVPVPPDVKSISQLLVIEGKLCFVHLQGQGETPGNWTVTGKADLWVMNEYGVKESWSKLVSVHPHMRELRPCKQLSPIGFMKTGNVLLKEKENLIDIIMYKQSGETYRSLWTGNVLAVGQLVIPYVESLISPNLSYDN